MSESVSIEIKNLKSYTELMNSLSEDDRKCVEIMNKQAAEALEKKTNPITKKSMGKKHNIMTVYRKLEWHNNENLTEVKPISAKELQ